LALNRRKKRLSLLAVANFAAWDVAAFWLLELDHVGAEKAEDLRARGARLVVGHIDDANARQRLVHAPPPRLAAKASTVVDRYQDGVSKVNIGAESRERGQRP